MTNPRENLLPEELDRIAARCSAVLVRDRLRVLFRPERITSLELGYDHCVLRTCGGRSYVARLGRDGNVILEEAS